MGRLQVTGAVSSKWIAGPGILAARGEAIEVSGIVLPRLRHNLLLQHSPKATGQSATDRNLHTCEPTQTLSLQKLKVSDIDYGDGEVTTTVGVTVLILGKVNSQARNIL